MFDKKFFALLATTLIAIAAVLNGDHTANAIGQLVLAAVAVITYVEARVGQKADKPDDNPPATLTPPVGPPR